MMMDGAVVGRVVVKHLVVESDVGGTLAVEVRWEEQTENEPNK